MAIPTIIKQWNECVQQAKKNSPSKQPVYGFISGKVLKDAQKCYCATSFIKKK